MLNEIGTIVGIVLGGIGAYYGYRAFIDGKKNSASIKTLEEKSSTIEEKVVALFIDGKKILLVSRLSKRRL